MTLWGKAIVAAVLLLLLVSVFHAGLLLSGAPGWESWRQSGLRGLIVYVMHAPEGQTRVWAGTSDGAHFSDDGGQNWRHVDTLPEGRVVAFASTRDGGLFAAAGGGLYRSDDGGDSWSRLGSTTLPEGVQAVLPLPGSGPLLAGTEAGLFASADLGATWRELGLGDELAVQTLIGTSATLLAGTPSGLWRSADGESWQQVGAPIGDANAIALAAAPGTPEVLYLGTGSPRGTLWQSRDGGESWQRTAGNLPSDFVAAVAAAPGQPLVVYLGAGGQLTSDVMAGVFRTGDGGASWQQMQSRLANVSVLSVAVLPGFPRTVLAGTNGAGVYRYLDADQTLLTSRALRQGLHVAEALLVGTLLVLWVRRLIVV